MRECDNLIHPFQHDPGVSQRQRVMENLLSGSAEIDSRTLADLLNYFMQLSRHIKFYEEDLSVNDWQPFFRNSLPFTIATIIKFDGDSINEKLSFYHQLFKKNPSSSGLQLLVHVIYYRLINPLNTWQIQFNGSELPVAFTLEKLIKNKLQQTVKKFIRHSNTAVKWYCIKPVDWQRLYENEVWNLFPTDLHDSDDSFWTEYSNQRDQTIALYDAIRELVPGFMNGMRLVADAATSSIDQSLVPLKAELREKHQPHLALLFAFLKLFQHLQGDLNSFSKKHLDFFYKKVLQLKPKEATPDKAHILFEIQNQLDSYLLKEGLLLKDGKDDNKTEVLFSLDDEIVVNKTIVADKRTLFLNNQTMSDTSYLEGVYMAPDAGKADGIDKNFPEEDLQSFPTLGAKNSKYTDPEHGFIKPYPNARLGFILASPVLLLNEGKRTVNITLVCELKDNYCEELTLSTGPTSDPCCEKTGVEEVRGEENKMTLDFKSACELYTEVEEKLGQSFYYISQDLIAQAQKKGVSANIIDRLKGFLTTKREICYCKTDETDYDAIVFPVIEDTEINGFEEEFTEDEQEILAEWFKPRRALKVLFSGEEEWIEPSEITTLEIDPISMTCNPDPEVSYSFVLKISVVLEADKPSITFYNGEQLEEDFNTTQPLVKIELDDKIKIDYQSDDEEKNEDSCCLGRLFKSELDVSLYHFFRNVIINDTTIDVEVCGLKNLIVQNDENVGDVNNPIVPFGVRPKIGSSFYIGNKELFSKNWQKFWINATWKDRPSDFKEHYKHYDYEPYEDGSNEITDASFKVSSALLEQGKWKLNGERRLFKESGADSAIFCNHSPLKYDQDVYDYQESDFIGKEYRPANNILANFLPLNTNTRDGFLRLTLEGVSFQHDRYSFVVARHMMALSNLVDPISIFAAQGLVTDAKKIIDAITARINTIQSRINDIQTSNNELIQDIVTPVSGLQSLIATLTTNLTAADIATAIATKNQISIQVNEILSSSNDINTGIDEIDDLVNDDPGGSLDFNNLGGVGLSRLAGELDSIIVEIGDKLKVDEDLKKGLPSEPYTPTIKNISIDYTATASITDIDLIHLYPFEGTYKPEELESQPTLLPTFCDEGTLFLGLKDLVPGSNVNMLFQLAEATADSESERVGVNWFYLDNNQWKPLREGFEVLDDATGGLTASGIIKFALPANMTSENTILPKGLHWIKASIPHNSRSVSETTGIHTQAVQVTFTNQEANDKMRLANALPAGSIAKLNEADASVKKVTQPYDGFDGRLPEESGHFYVRTSELLRHKGRSIQKFDYERLALEAFPKLFKVKCINHSFGLNAHKYLNDFPVAPGYVLLAVIPDMNQLKASATFEPRVPVSLLEKLRDYLLQRTSPFVRLKIMNPRYEKVHFCVKVKLYTGRDENFYKAKLRQDLREFLAPWAVGQYEKLTFGQCIYRSDLVRFLETRDYLDYILDLKMIHQNETDPPFDQQKVCPVTPRSILIAGDIDVCINQKDCETWEMCDEQNRKVKIDCCDHEPIAVADYCKEPEIN